MVEGEAGAEGEQEKSSSMPKVYRAPEVRDLPPNQPSTSTSADVYRSANRYISLPYSVVHGIPFYIYSFAIILFEIATRMDPRSVSSSVIS